MQNCTHTSRETEYINQLFIAMANENCRHVLYYLRQCDGISDVGDINRYLLEDVSDGDGEVVTVALYHVVLPRLIDAGIVSYDPVNERVLYEGGSFTTELIDWIMERERIGY